MENSIMIKENVLETGSYIPGRNHINSGFINKIRQNPLKLSSNTNILGPSPKVLDAIKNELSNVNHYPDPEAKVIKEKLSEKLCVDTRNLLVGNGSAEIIDLINRAYIKNGDEVLLGYPSFPKYEISARIHAANVKAIPMLNNEHDLDKIAVNISSKTKIIYIDNPSNPVGTAKTKKDIISFIEKVPENLIIVLDEAYLEFNNPKEHLDYSQLIKKKNVLIMRTLSKAYGIAGLRIGYLIGNSSLISYVNKVREVFNVNSLALSAGIAAINDNDHLIKNLILTQQQKEYFYKKLDQLNYCYIKSKTNFILINTERDLGEVDNFLLRHGIIIRPIRLNGSKSGYIRVTIGKPEENKYLIEILSNISKAIQVIN